MSSVRQLQPFQASKRQAECGDWSEVQAVRPLIRRLVRRVFGKLAADVVVSSLDTLLALVDGLELVCEDSDDDGPAEDAELCSTW